MAIDKPKLFLSRREFMTFAIIALIGISIRLGWRYKEYQDFIHKPFYYTYATVLSQYIKHKNNRSYTILKLLTDQHKIIYTSISDTRPKYKRVYIKLMPSSRIGFVDYLGGMYCKSTVKRILELPPSTKSHLQDLIASQHAKDELKQLYGALFLATPISRKLRTQIANLGISHLVALSGFHLGILWGLLYGIISMLYRPLQQRYFPYRYILKDVGSIAMIMLWYYLWLTGYPPSLTRSYAMMLTGWIMVLAGIELVSFTFIASVTLLLLLLSPSLIVSLGFWLSISGVFYIFLLLQYCHDQAKWLVALLCIPIGIFVLMQPLAHLFFGVTTLYQLLSPSLSILFAGFYPLATSLHLIELGGLIDDPVWWLLSLPTNHPINTTYHLIPIPYLIPYLALSIGAIWSRTLFSLTLISALAYNGYLFVWQL